MRKLDRVLLWGIKKRLLGECDWRRSSNVPAALIRRVRSNGNRQTRENRLDAAGERTELNVAP